MTNVSEDPILAPNPTPQPDTPYEPAYVFQHTNAWHAVISGINPGVYFDWVNAGPEVFGIPYNYHRSFRTEREARMFYDAELAEGRVRYLNG